MESKKIRLIQSLLIIIIALVNLASLSMSKIEYTLFQKKYREGGTIGKGSFGKIVKITNRSNGEELALKKITAHSLRMQEEANKEISLLSQYKHCLIVKIFEFYEVKVGNHKHTEEYEIGIVLELGSHSLQHMILHQKPNYASDSILRFAIDFIQLFAWLQKHNIVHRDIKPANIIVFGANLNCKLADFGLCCLADGRPKGVAGSFHYASPGLKIHFQGQKHKVAKTNPFKDDVYSLGLTLYELVMKSISKDSECPLNPYQTVMQACNSHLLAKIIHSMLQVDEQARPTFYDLMLSEQVQHFLKVQSYNPLTLQKYCQPQGQNQQKSIRFCEFQCEAQEKQCKTEKKEYGVTYNFEKMRIPEAGIQSVQIIDDFLYCGCDDGRIVVVHLFSKDRVMEIDRKHSKYVSVLKLDSLNNLWSADGAGNLWIWNRKALKKCLQNHNKITPENKKTIFNTPRKQNLMKIQTDENTVSEVSFDFEGGSISAMECFDENRFGVGFSSGMVFLKWGEFEPPLHKNSHEGPVTCLKVCENRLYSGGVDGQVKVYDLLTLKMLNRFVSISEIILSVVPQSNGFSVITHNGNQEAYDQHFQAICSQKLLLKNILAFCSTSQLSFILSEDGNISDGKDVIFRGQDKGWNCMTPLGEHELVAASFKGEIVLVSWKSQE